MIAVPRLAVLAVALSLAVPVAFADIDHDEAKRLQESGEILGLERIIELSRARRTGHIVETELKNRHGRYVYEVETVDEYGVVWEMYFDASTGNIIREQAEKDEDR